MEYNLHLYDHGGKMLLSSWAEVNQVGVVLECAAIGCGVVAMRRESNWWALAVGAATFLALIYFFGDM